MADIFKKVTSIDPDEKAGVIKLQPIMDDTDENDGAEPKEPPKQAVPTPKPRDLPPTFQESEAEAAPETPGFGWMKWVGALSVLAWLGASFSYLYGFFELGQKWTDLTPLQMTGLILTVLLPAILLALLFFTFRKLALLSHDARNLAAVAHDLSQPNDTVIAKTAIMSKAIKTEINSVDARMDQALARMQVLEEVISKQTLDLSKTVDTSRAAAQSIDQQLGSQKNALETIANLFDTKMATLSSILTEHSVKLERSTKLAEQKISEARVSVEGVAAKINAASDIVRGNAVEASATLTSSHEEIELLGKMIQSRSGELDDVYRKHAQELKGMIDQLNDEHQTITVAFEDRLAKMRDMALSAKVGAESLTEASEAGRSTVQALAEAARYTDSAVKQRFAEMESMVKFSSEKAETISDRAAQRVQDSLSQTRREIVRIENDMGALQDRLSLRKIATEEPIVQPTAKMAEKEQKQAPAKPKKRNRLKFKPLEEDFPPVEPPNPAQDTSQRPILRGIDDIELDDASLSIEIEPVDIEQDIALPDPDKDIKSFDSELYTPRTEADQSQQRTKKSGWRWRDMLGGLGSADEDTLPEAPMTPPAPHNNAPVGTRVITALTSIGLAPSAIVDDGCIIEAANTRRAKGALSMSQAVLNRLGDPVRHLHRAMIDDATLKNDALHLVDQYQRRIGLIENDRETIRTVLEAEVGRAFLLCDAAING